MFFELKTLEWLKRQQHSEQRLVYAQKTSFGKSMWVCPCVPWPQTISMVFLGFHHKLFAVANATEISTKVWVLHFVPPSQFPIQPPSKRFRHQGHHVHHVLIRSGWMNVTLEICRVKKALGISEQMKIHLTELSTGLFQCWRLDSDVELSDNGLSQMNTLSSFSGWQLLLGHNDPIFRHPSMAMSCHGHPISRFPLQRRHRQLYQWRIPGAAEHPQWLQSLQFAPSFFASVSWRSPLCSHCTGWVNEIGPGLLFFFASIGTSSCLGGTQQMTRIIGMFRHPNSGWQGGRGDWGQMEITGKS